MSRSHRYLRFVPPAVFIAALLSLGGSRAHASYPTPFPNGANALFAGHSFFVPVAGYFDQIAIDNGYTDHAAEFVISGSQSGSPKALWDNLAKRNEIIGHLDDRDTELFGLTVFSEDDSSFEDYARWFNEALKHNPDTQFYIGHPQTPEGAVTPSVAYDALTEELGNTTFQIVKQLRAAYPNNPVHFVQYGKTASIMHPLVEAGELPDLRALLVDAELMIGRDDALFTDVSPGHAGTMLQEVSALSWMNLLYGADVTSLQHTDFESDVTAIVEEVIAFNQPYQAITPGDYNGDGRTDAADYTVWRDADGELGLTLPPDGNGDGLVNELDYALWQQSFGRSATSFSGVSLVVPEPQGLALSAAALIVMRCFATTANGFASRLR